MRRILSDDPLGQLEAAIADDDMNLAHNIVFRVTRGGSDLALAYAATVRCLKSKDRILRTVGVRALGDIARVFDTLEEKYKEVLEEALVDPDRYVREVADESAMDLYTFLHWQFRNWVPKEPPEPPEMRFHDLPDGGYGPVTRGNDLVQEHLHKSYSPEDNWRMCIGLPALGGRIRYRKPVEGR